MTTADEWADEHGNPMFDRMTDGEIAAYFEDRDREPPGEPPEPDWEELREDRERQHEKHLRDVHDGGACDCAEPF